MKIENTYDLSKDWFVFVAENYKVKPVHTHLFFFIINKWNLLFWKKNFGLPTDHTMECLNIKSYKTYINALKDLEDFGFIKFIERSKNQNTANIIEVVKNTKANTKADDKANTKALIKATTQSDDQSDSQSTVSINKQYNKEQLNNKQLTQDEMNKQKVSQPENQTHLENNETLLKEVEKVMLPKNHYLDLYNRASRAFKKQKSNIKRLNLGNETYDNFNEIYKTYTVGELKTALKGLMIQKNALNSIFTPHHLLKDNMFETYLHAGKNGIKNLYSQNQKKVEFKL